MNRKLLNILMYFTFFMYIIGAAYNDILTLFAFVITVYLIIKCDRQKTIELCALLAPIAAIIKFKSNISLFNYVYLISLIVLLLKSNLKINKVVGLFILLIIIEGLYSVCINGFDVISQIISFSIGLSFLIVVLSNKYDYDISEILEKFSFSLIVSAIIEFFSEYFPGINKYLSSATLKIETGEKLSRLSGFIGNPNHFSLALSLVIISFLVLIVTKNKKKLYYIHVILLSIIGIYTLSKSFLISLIISFILIYIYLFFKYPKKCFNFLIVLVILTIILYSLKDYGYLKVLINRLDYSNFGDINSFTTGRIDRYQLYLNYIMNNTRVLLFGDGIYNSLEYTSHCFYIELIYYFGIIGTIILLRLFFKIVNTNNKKISFIYTFPIVIYLFRGLAINLVTSIIFPIYIIIMYLFLAEGRKEHEQQ